MKRTAIIVILIVLLTFTGCKNNNISTSTPKTSSPIENINNSYISNYRTNLNNGGLLCDDENYIFYKNSAMENALYRLDKKTKEKVKLTDVNRSSLSSINVTSDYVYYYGINDSSQKTIFRINKDGSNKIQILTDVYVSFVIRDGYLYYSKPDEMQMKDLYKYNLETGNNELLVSGMIDNVNISDDGNKIYYRKFASDIDVRELDVNTKTEKSLLKSTSKTSQVGYFNYYNDALYYIDGLSIQRYSITDGQIETVSSIDTGKQINSLIVSDLGVFYLARMQDTTGLKESYLFNADTRQPVAITTFSTSDNINKAYIAGGRIVVFFNNNGGQIKSYTIKGEENSIGF